MDRFQGGDSIENGGMFTREQIMKLSQYNGFLCVGN